MKTHGVNFNKLVAIKMSLILVPDGGEVAAAIRSIAEPGKLAAAKEAVEWVAQAIALARTAPDNLCGESEEAIAAAIIKQVELREIRNKVIRACKKLPTPRPHPDGAA